MSKKQPAKKPKLKKAEPPKFAVTTSGWGGLLSISSSAKVALTIEGTPSELAKVLDFCGANNIGCVKPMVTSFTKTG